MGLLIAPRLSACTLGFTPVDKRVASLRLQVGEQVLTALMRQTAVQSTHPFWSPWDGCWKVHGWLVGLQKQLTATGRPASFGSH